VPLHCFIRMRKEPVFRIKDLQVTGPRVTIKVEHGSNQGKLTVREEIALRRNRIGELVVESRMRFS